MSQRIDQRLMTVAAGTAAPGTSFAFSDMPPGVVEKIDVYIPAGHANKTGIRIYYSGSQVIPYVGEQYLSGNGDQYSFVIDDFPTGQGWGGAAFNNDVYQHTFKILFHTREVSANANIQLPPLIMLPMAQE